MLSSSCLASGGRGNWPSLTLGEQACEMADRLATRSWPSSRLDQRSGELSLGDPTDTDVLRARLSKPRLAQAPSRHVALSMLSCSRLAGRCKELGAPSEGDAIRRRKGGLKQALAVLGCDGRRRDDHGRDAPC